MHTYEEIDDTVRDRHLDDKLNPLYVPPNFLKYWKRNPSRWHPHKPRI